MQNRVTLTAAFLWLTVLPPWVILRHVVNHATYHRGQVAAKLKRFSIQQPDTDFVFWAREQIPQPT